MRIMEKQVALHFVVLDFSERRERQRTVRSGGVVYFQSSITFKRFEIFY